MGEIYAAKYQFQPPRTRSLTRTQPSEVQCSSSYMTSCLARLSMCNDNLTSNDSHMKPRSRSRSPKLASPQFPRTQFDCIDAEMLLSAAFMNAGCLKPLLTNNFPVRVTLTPQDSTLPTRLGQVNRLRAIAHSSNF